MASDTQLTPMMAQYRRIKSELPKDALLLFRLGDFYEMFFEDAQIERQLRMDFIKQTSFRVQWHAYCCACARASMFLKSDERRD